MNSVRIDRVALLRRLRAGLDFYTTPRLLQTGARFVMRTGEAKEVLQAKSLSRGKAVGVGHMRDRDMSPAMNIRRLRRISFEATRRSAVMVAPCVTVALQHASSV